MIIIATKTQCQSMDSISEDAKQRLKEIFPGISARGFNMMGGLSSANNILLANQHAIFLKDNDGRHYLFTDYEFDPHNGTFDKLKNEFSKVNVLIITHSLQDASVGNSYHKVPEWIKKFNNLDCLILDNVTFKSEFDLEGLKLKLLGVQRGEVKEVQKLVQSISKITGLEFFMYDQTFSDQEIAELKKLVPRLVTFKPASIP